MATKYPHPGGLTTNANPNMPNGMEFNPARTTQDSAFAHAAQQHWDEEDRANGTFVSSDYTQAAQTDYMQDYMEDCRANENRFMYYPTTKNGGK